VKLSAVIDSAAETHRAASRFRALAAAPAAAPVLVGGLIVAAFVARVVLARAVLAPWVMPDELEYTLVSRSFVSTGHYLFRDHALSLRTIYPALISPAWWAGSVHTAYTLIKTINAGLMTLGAIPVYLWGRRLMTPLWAVVPVVLYLAMPGFVYTAEILTENAFVPAAVLAMFAIAATLERPTLLRQALAFGAIVLASAARLQGLIFLLVLPTAILISLVLDAVAVAPGERRRAVAARLRRFSPTIGLLVLGLVAYALLKLASGGSISNGLGTYGQLSSAHYSLWPALRWIVYHFAELAFSVGMVPVAALIVLFGLACRRETAPSPAERAFLAVASSAVLWTVVQIGTFSSHFVLRVEERYMFNVAPVLFLALVVWLARGLPRPGALTAAAVLVPVALLLALPYESLISTQAFMTDTFGLIPLYRLTVHVGLAAGDVRILVGVGALLAGVAFASLPRRWARVAVPVAVLAFLVLSSRSVFSQVRYISQHTRHAGGLVGDPSWIDHAVGRNARVEFLYTTDIEADPHILWQSEFWNRSVRRVFGVTSQDPSIPDISAPLDPATGKIVPSLPPGSLDLGPRYVVAAKNVDVVGTPITSAGLLTLYRVRSPLRLGALSSGITADGWTGPSASYTSYGSGRAAHEIVTVSRPKLNGPPPAHVTVVVGRLAVVNGAPSIGTVWARRTWTVQNGTAHRFDLPLRGGPFQVQMAVSPTFVPSQYGLPDSRTLGVLASLAPGR